MDRARRWPRTHNVQFGCLVAAVGYHNPHMLADRARSLDHFSNGRFILGLGSGWNQRDYEEYDFEFGTAASRLKDLERDLKIISDRMDTLNPPPIQNPLPILIGGGGEKVTLRIVAEYATIWNGQEEPEVMRTRTRCWTSGARKSGAIRTRSNARCKSSVRSSTNWTSTTTPA